MAKTNAIKLFEDRLGRSVWDDEKEEFCRCKRAFPNNSGHSVKKGGAV